MDAQRANETEAADVTAVTPLRSSFLEVTAVTSAPENRFAQRRADGGATALDNLVQLCRRHHRLVHEGGFGVERIDEGNLRFTRPDGRVIDEHPQLPAASVGGLRDAISSEGKPPIDASSWVLPGGKMDLDLTPGDLMQFQEKQAFDVGGLSWPVSRFDEHCRHAANLTPRAGRAENGARNVRF